MQFNSITFALFLPIVFILYWFVFNQKLRWQNLFLVVASYVFYGWWDWRFLILLFISSLSDFIFGYLIDKESRQFRRKTFLILSICINLGMLGFFKYYNFFVDSFIDLFSLFGIRLHASTLQIILPVGISFYTFQSMSYTISVYWRQLKSTKDIVSFFSYLSFFPQLVAGPIETANNLLPQFTKKRVFDYAKAADGMRQILWGLFKKIVIADNCAGFVDSIFSNYSQHSGSTLVFGVILFAFQIYGDFSGYSDIAIGTARLFGFELMQNFRFPYFSKSITEIWRRWHISLSNWLRDYLYTPLAISTRNWGLAGILFSSIITFTLCGLWHGANWVYVVFGLLHGLALSYEILTRKQRKKWSKKTPVFIYDSLSMLLTFIFWNITLVFFRSASIHDALGYFKGMFSTSLFSAPHPDIGVNPLTISVLIPLFIIFEWMQRDKQHAMQIDSTRMSRPVRWACYFLLIFLIGMLGNTGDVPFIYFQF
ncbi:MAG: membrane-bound O-acyltransferase family protein [Bacteroidetes bacterium HGW-Bacteroidetes-21]|jgi:D-alanyl-lipoteichoic acid acyltransferase DltB (MBOAT superfamily)|nr:MAG: membrane-bound O-acyltransferase family protein [Bacteroidetes bacterium HGW-Bacteroidetes-21]